MRGESARSDTTAGLAVRVLQYLYGRSPATRFGTPFALDIAAWATGLVLAALFRYEGDVERISWASVALLWVAVALLQLLFGLALHLYRGRHPYGSFDEVKALVYVVVPIALIAGGTVLLFGTFWGLARSLVFIAAPMALLLMAGARYLKRLIVESTMRPDASRARRTLVYGAGDLGAGLVRRMMRDPLSPYIAVGFIDDNPRKGSVHHHGVRVLGTGDELAAILATTPAEVLVIAIRDADSALLRQISDIATPLGLKVKVLPPLEQLLRSGTRLGSLRDIEIGDLIGRMPVDTDVDSIAQYVEGKRVLVTGAGGSIGSELAIQLARFHPAKLVLLDRDETGLQQTQIGVQGNGLLDTDDVVLVDIRDQDALDPIFQDARPEVVFHAAALKHLPMLEHFPDEAWKTNVLGTLNVLRSSRAVGVTTFVNISTDKAANPTSVLGHSKRVSEKLTAWAAEESGHTYVSVRFGNVLGSRGSMLPTFQSLIEAGGPLTVTHRDATRYFMTIPEACQLVIQAGAIGRPGEVLVLDMGEPVRIMDIAERMIEMSGRDVAIKFTGLRPGEKLHEELFGAAEIDERPFHPKISHTVTGSITPDRLDKAGWERRMTAQPRDNDTVAMEALRDQQVTP